MARRLLARAAGLAGVVVLTSSLGGCARTVSMREAGPVVHGGSNADNAAVFASPALLAATGGYPEDARDFGRRDDLLARRAPEAAYAQEAWTEPDRPSLSRARRIYIDAQPDRVIYFREDRGDVSGDWPRYRSYRGR